MQLVITYGKLLVDNVTGKAGQNVCKRQGLFTYDKKIPCIVFLAIFKDNATFFAVVVSSHGKHVVMPKKMCVSVTNRPQVLATDTNFFLWFCFFTINSFRRKMLSVSSLFLLQLTSKLTLLKAQKRFVFVAFARFRQHVS